MAYLIEHQWPMLKNFFDVITLLLAKPQSKSKGNTPIVVSITPKKLYNIGHRLQFRKDILALLWIKISWLSIRKKGLLWVNPIYYRS
jgi:hypothetical protein